MKLILNGANFHHTAVRFCRPVPMENADTRTWGERGHDRAPAPFFLTIPTQVFRRPRAQAAATRWAFCDRDTLWTRSLLLVKHENVQKYNSFALFIECIPKQQKLVSQPPQARHIPLHWDLNHSNVPYAEALFRLQPSWE